MSMMNPKVARLAERVIELYQEELAALAAMPPAQLVELEHEMEHLRLHPRFSVRTAAELVRTAAVMARKKKLGQE